ncbi:hypothetical protein R1sor_001265 [Riccia sorocarpa]|uniref:Endonuclease/exonuclease/phosphatase domain-containing protein n=1 Tax=Riccia sorocarpa TaxID=122646 RepID=A0ABD3GWC4_9MARC
MEGRIEALQAQLTVSHSLMEEGKLISILPNVTQRLSDMEDCLQTSFKSQEHELRKEISSHDVQIQPVLQDRASSSTTVPDFGKVLEEIDSQIKSYASVTRETNVTLFQEQDREGEARQARAKNIRIMGLAEENGEDPRLVALQLLQEEMAITTVIVIVIVIYSNALYPNITTIKMEYAVRVGRSDQGPRVMLIEGMMGHDGMDVDNWKRQSLDEGRNGLTVPMQQLIDVCGLTISNGTSQFPDTCDLTCRTPNGASIVDFLVISDEMKGRISSFKLRQCVPESDHCALMFDITGVEYTRAQLYRNPNLCIWIDLGERNIDIK